MTTPAIRICILPIGASTPPKEARSNFFHDSACANPPVHDVKDEKRFTESLSTDPPRKDSIRSCLPLEAGNRIGRLGSKMGNSYLRKLLVVGATSVIRRAKNNDSSTGPWLHALLERKPARVVTVAVANKTARTAWAILSRGEIYRRPATIQAALSRMRGQMYVMMIKGPLP